MRFADISDKDLVEQICNDPSIRLWTAFDGAPPCVADRYLTAPSFTVLDDGGCFLAQYIDQYRYGIHTNILPGYRGANAVELAKEALRMAFIETDALELITYVPDVVPQAALLARQMGFRPIFNREKIWPANGELYGLGFYSLGIDSWILSSDVCDVSGKAFHKRLHDELCIQEHPADAAHNSYVGAAVEMIKAGRVTKAIDIYNRWARFAFYQEISVLSDLPLRIDIKQCVLRIDNDQFFVEASNA